MPAPFITLLGSIARTASNVSDAIDLTQFDPTIKDGSPPMLRVQSDVTAVSGVSPTMTMLIQDSVDGGTNWNTIGTFTAPTAATVGYHSLTAPWVGGAGVPSVTTPVEPRPDEPPPKKEPVVPPRTDADGYVLRVEYWTLEGDFANIEYTEDCFNHCPDCGGVVPSGSGSGSGQPLECPPLTWLNGWQVHYCSGVAPYPPGTVSIPGGVNQLLVAAVCNYVGHLIVAGGFTMTANGCEPNAGAIDPVLTPLGFYPDLLLTLWTNQGNPIYFPGQEPPGGGGSTPGLHLLVKYREYDIPGDVEIISKECVEVPICTCADVPPEQGGGRFDPEAIGPDLNPGDPPPETP